MKYRTAYVISKHIVSSGWFSLLPVFPGALCDPLLLKPSVESEQLWSTNIIKGQNILKTARKLRVPWSSKQCLSKHVVTLIENQQLNTNSFKLLLGSLLNWPMPMPMYLVWNFESVHKSFLTFKTVPISGTESCRALWFVLYLRV